MYASLLVFGVIATLTGIAMVGFGIPINEFSFGNTLIVAGTTAILGGLILIALADAVRHLRRIADSLMARPSPRSSRPLDDAYAGSRPSPGTGRIPFPPKHNFEGRGPAPMEPRLDAAPSIDTAMDNPFDRPRPAFPSMANSPDLRLDQDRDAMSSPRRSQLSASQAALSEALSDFHLDQSFRPAPPSDAPGQSGPFDSLWPADPRPGRTSAAEAEPKFSAPKFAPAETETALRGHEQAPGQKRDEARVEAHAVSILKSGVIDEMAYTLYSDGSIEAELPQGTMRFASITELRAYLEKSS